MQPLFPASSMNQTIIKVNYVPLSCDPILILVSIRIGDKRSFTFSCLFIFAALWTKMLILAVANKKTIHRSLEFLRDQKDDVRWTCFSVKAADAFCTSSLRCIAFHLYDDVMVLRHLWVLSPVCFLLAPLDFMLGSPAPIYRDDF